MDLPPEVMQVSMRVNQRYFALRDARRPAAAFFAFVANIMADGWRRGDRRRQRAGAARAASRMRGISGTWTASARWKARRGGAGGGHVPREAGQPGRAGAPAGARWPARSRRWSAPTRRWPSGRRMLAKADLVTGMVGEFPELQGVMGRYYASHDGEDRARRRRDPRPLRAARAGRCGAGGARRYRRGAGRQAGPARRFFAIGEKPTGSGDPYALRRAALGIIRIIRENGLRESVLPLIERRRLRHSGRSGRCGDTGLPPRPPARPASRRRRPPRRAERRARRRGRTTTSCGCWRAPRRWRP